MTKYYKGNIKERKIYFISQLRVQFFRVRDAWGQEFEADGHIASTGRKQRHMNAGAYLHPLSLSLSLPSFLSPFFSSFFFLFKFSFVPRSQDGTDYHQGGFSLLS